MLLRSQKNCRECTGESCLHKKRSTTIDFDIFGIKKPQQDWGPKNILMQ